MHGPKFLLGRPRPSGGFSAGGGAIFELSAANAALNASISVRTCSSSFLSFSSSFSWPSVFPPPSLLSVFNSASAQSALKWSSHPSSLHRSNTIRSHLPRRGTSIRAPFCDPHSPTLPGNTPCIYISRLAAWAGVAARIIGFLQASALASVVTGSSEGRGGQIRLVGGQDEGRPSYIEESSVP